mgnify:CR=1 FL=1
MGGNKTDKSPKSVQEVFLRDYSKVIFFYPLFFISLILWIIELIVQGSITWLAYFWLVMFFMNLFVIAFDVSSTKFFLIILIIAVIVILLIFVILPYAGQSIFDALSGTELGIVLPASFYFAVMIILAIILGIVLINSRLNYWKIERNEAYHKRGIFTTAERYPVKSLRIQKSINDVFEFFLLRAGDISLMFSKSEIFHLHTILNINKRSNELDYLLSHMHVEIDELDT